ncbi:MAG: 1-phosphofructokinase family hexose kinase [Candidatus Hydrogenedentes bacterium]|nr:1-phosphofructokinase family hexose kinase [Candidatus Hydrogenedentota bacterium]
MILTVTPNPCVDKTVFLEAMAVGRKNVCHRVTTIPGGKGNNVARAVKALGEQSASVVLVGGAPGQHVVDMITGQDGLECHPVWIAENTRTITTVLEEGPHRQTPLFEPGPRVGGAEKERLIDEVRSRLGATGILTLNGTVPDPTLQDVYRTLISLARAQGVTVILDTHGPELALGLEAAPYMVKPNDVEAAELVGYALDSEAARWRAIDWFHGKGVSLVVLSLGAEGVLVSDGLERLHVKPPPIEEVNAVGSGDCLVAGMAVGLLRQWPLEQCAVLGVSAGTVNAMRWDIGHVTQAEVERIAPRVAVVRC